MAERLVGDQAARPADRKLYRQWMQKELSAVGNLDIAEMAVEDLIVSRGAVAGIVAGDGTQVSAPAVVLTTGTFLKGVIHIGDRRIPAGRANSRAKDKTWGGIEAPALGLSDRLYGLGLSMGRLKTGTPARLDGRAIDWAGLDMQPADDEPAPFSFMTDRITVPQIACGVTGTTRETHRIIEDNIGKELLVLIYSTRGLSLIMLII